METEFETGMFGLPLEVKFCKKCTLSNQRPVTSVEFKSQSGANKSFMNFDENGICDACSYHKIKKEIDWKQRESELLELLNRFRRNDGKFDVIVPGSGGKDSVMTSHLLKYKYNMNPLLVTWPPIISTDIGRRNFNAWLQSGFSNYSYYPNQKANRILTRLAFENLLHPFQPFTIGQKNLAPKIALLHDIPLVMYGEYEAEYGSRISTTETSKRDINTFADKIIVENFHFGGVNATEIMKKYNLSLSDLEAYFPANIEEVKKKKLEFHYLGYFIKWHPQEVYYYCVQNTNFSPNDYRTEGSYGKYSSLDDKIDWLHFYSKYIKYGEGRATNDAAQEIRNGDITRDEGIRLVKRFDGEFPQIYLDECLEYMQLSREQFIKITDQFRPEHLWKKNNSHWILKNPIWKDYDFGVNHG